MIRQINTKINELTSGMHPLNHCLFVFIFLFYFIFSVKPPNVITVPLARVEYNSYCCKIETGSSNSATLCQCIVITFEKVG